MKTPRLRCMRPRLVGLFLSGFVLATVGCSSGQGADRPGSPASSVALSGNVGLTVVALDGPIYLPGPFAAKTLPGLLSLMRHAQHDRALVCAQVCWAGARPPRRSILIAVQVGETACDALTGAHTALHQPDRLQIDVSSANKCVGADRSARSAQDALFAIRMTELPRVQRLVITVRGVQGYATRSTTIAAFH